MDAFKNTRDGNSDGAKITPRRVSKASQTSGLDLYFRVLVPGRDEFNERIGTSWDDRIRKMNASNNANGLPFIGA